MLDSRLSKMINDDVKLQHVRIGVDVTHNEFMELIKLTNVKHEMEAARTKTELKIKKLRRAPGPITLIFKPIIFKSRRSDLDELEEELAQPKSSWSHTNHFKNIYGADAVKHTGDIVKVCTIIMKEIKYFRTIAQRSAFFKWLKAEKPHMIADYKNNCITGKTNLAKIIRRLKKDHLGEVIKGFRMFIKKYYRPLERMAVRRPSGHVSFIPLNIK